MRILFISNLYPPYALGGWEQNCQEIVDRLGKRGHTCHVLTSCYGVQNWDASEENVTRALHLQANVDYYRPLDFFLRRPGRERANRRALRGELDTFEPDVIFIWGMWNLSTQVAYWAERWLPGRVAYAVAGYWFMEPNVHEAYWRRRARRPWTKVFRAPARWLALRLLEREHKAFPLALERVACVSEYVRGKLTEAGILLHDSRVIHNGIDPQPFLEAKTGQKDEHDGLRLIYTGGVLAHKGVHTAIEALGLLKQRGLADDLSLTIVGNGHPDYESQLKRRVSDLELDQRVAFRRRVPREKIPNVLGEADVFLFTSVWEEPIARSVMEAMVAGLAVIGTGVGGQREMLEDGVNALVYPPDDPDTLAECILRLRRDPYLRTQLAKAGRKTVLAQFTLKRMVDEMEAWLREMCR